jgi:peptidoglycan/LPS O-acetylase OafA/YrhL
MSVPEAIDTGSEALIVEPVPPIMGSDRVGSPEHALAARSRSADGVTVTSPETAPMPIVVPVRKRFTELDGLRGLAALFVVLYHLRDRVEDVSAPDHLYRLIGGGYLMVDLFFALSGFVLARTMLSTASLGAAARFAALRARRFMPLHLTGIAIALACTTAVLLSQHFDIGTTPPRPAFSADNEGPLAWLSASLLIQGLVGPQYAGYAAAWSLSIELWVNVILVVAIALVPWPDRRRWVGPLALLSGVVLLILFHPEAEGTVGLTALGRGLTGLGAGMVIYWVYTIGVRHGWSLPVARRGSGAKRAVRWPTIGAAVGLLTLLACMHWSKALLPLNFLQVFPVAGLLLFCLAQPVTGPMHRLMNTRGAQWLGSRSFALYALHVPILKTVALACFLAGWKLSDPAVSAFLIAMSLICALIAADLGHRFVEQLLVPKKRVPATPASAPAA